MAVYKIVIEDKTSESFNPVAGQETSSTTSQASSSNRKISMNDIGLFVAYRQVKPFVTQVISAEIQNVSLRTGSNRLQEKANFYYSLANRAISLGESIAVGAKVGGAPGALVAAAVGVSKGLLDIGMAQERLFTERQLEYQSISLTNVRAGSKGSRRV